MRCTRQVRLALHSRDDIVGPGTGRTIRAVRDRYEAWRQRRQALHRLPERGFHSAVRGREELE